MVYSSEGLGFKEVSPLGFRAYGLLLRGFRV